MSRKIKDGSTAYVYILVTDTTGADISTVPFEVSVVPDTAGPNTPAGEFTAPHETSGPGATPNTYRIALRVVADGPAKYRVFIRPVTGDESEIFDGGGYTITP